MVASEDPGPSTNIVFALFVALVIVVNLVVILGLRRGRLTRNKLLTGLVKMYKDNDIAEYYDSTILESYKFLATNACLRPTPSREPPNEKQRDILELELHRIS